MKKLINTKYEGLINANYLFPNPKEPITYMRITAAQRTTRALSGAKLPDVQLIRHTYATAGTEKWKGGFIDWTNDGLD